MAKDRNQARITAAAVAFVSAGGADAETLSVEQLALAAALLEAVNAEVPRRARDPRSRRLFYSAAVLGALAGDVAPAAVLQLLLMSNATVSHEQLVEIAHAVGDKLLALDAVHSAAVASAALHPDSSLLQARPAGASGLFPDSPFMPAASPPRTLPRWVDSRPPNVASPGRRVERDPRTVRQSPAHLYRTGHHDFAGATCP